MHTKNQCARCLAKITGFPRGFKPDQCISCIKHSIETNEEPAAQALCPGVNCREERYRPISEFTDGGLLKRGYLPLHTVCTECRDQAPHRRFCSKCTWLRDFTQFKPGQHICFVCHSKLKETRGKQRLLNKERAPADAFGSTVPPSSDAPEADDEAFAQLVARLPEEFLGFLVGMKRLEDSEAEQKRRAKQERKQKKIKQELLAAERLESLAHRAIITEEPFKGSPMIIADTPQTLTAEKIC
jgi:hypothetical protein